jgi:hypothetical protein
MRNLEELKRNYADLQAIEIPQNRQRIPWKSLEKKGPDLEKLAITALKSLGDVSYRCTLTPIKNTSPTEP